MPDDPQPRAPDALDLKRLVLPQRAAQRFRLARTLPPDDLAHLVDNHWVIEWDLRDAAPHSQEVLPQPSMNLAYDTGALHLYGVSTRRWSHTLRDAGRIFGTKLRPGAGFLLTGAPASAWTDRGRLLVDVFPAARALEAAFHDADDATRQSLVEDFLRAHARPPEGTPWADARRALTVAEGDPEITTVEALGARLGVSARQLQRLFRDCVGVSPKWVLRHLRLHEAAACVARGTDEPMADIAARLGYCDQSHFIRDFTRTVGDTPARYAAACLRARERA
ncbi:MAG: helix-turn-helix domain-containing protein [Polyangiales bacterium]